jgi:hypothetical protein
VTAGKAVTTLASASEGWQSLPGFVTRYWELICAPFLFGARKGGPEMAKQRIGVKRLKIFKKDLYFGVLLLLFVIVFTTFAWGGWGIQTPDPGRYPDYQVGSYTSIAVDANNCPHISYVDETNYDLKYAKWTGSSWSIETVDSIGDVDYHTSIALDANEYPYISYFEMGSSSLKFAGWNGSSWSIDTIDSAGDVGMYSSIAVDTSNYPHISYYDSTNGDLKYAKWNDSSWSIQTVDSTGDTGRWTSIAVDTSNYPHISYYDSTNGDLKYAKWTGSSWSIQTVDSTGDTGQWTSIALDTSNYPHISYYYATSCELKYAKWTGSSWSIETLTEPFPAGDREGRYTSIALDTNNCPHISYQFYMKWEDQFGETENLKYAKWTGSSWSIETVDSEGRAGYCTSIALDANDYPHISYFEMGSSSLKYAKWTNNPTLSWTGETNYTTDGLDPESGYPDTNFIYRVKYMDQDNDAPASGYPKVHIMKAGSEIEGSPFAMSEVDPGDTNYTDGKLYTYSKSKLGPGMNYTYYLEAKDVWNASATGDPTSPLDGPDVTNHTPTLSWTGETNYTTDGLDPESGYPDTNFIYRVRYTDEDNDAPASGYPKVHIKKAGSEISGSPFAMSEVDPGDTTYTDGKLYTYTKSGLGQGTDYTYYFEGKDVWNASATGTPTSPLDAPDVESVPTPPSPVLEVSPSSLDFGEVPIGETRVKAFTISNSSEGTLNGTITTDREWISVNPVSFDSNYVTVSVTVYPHNLNVWMTYTGTVTVDSNGGKETVNISIIPTCVKTYPNPYSLSSGKPLTFWGTGVPYATIKIYTLGGELVKTLKETKGEDKITWDGRNEDGDRVVRGIYFFTAKNPRERNTGKFTVVR